MRKLLIFLISIMIFTGCVNKNEGLPQDEIKIVTSFYPVYLFTQNVVKDVPNVAVNNLTLKSSTGCLHGYHLTTANMKDIESADIFIINGAGMEESFLDDIKEAYPNLTIVDTSVGVNIAESSFSDEENSHIWLSLDNAKLQVENIKKALVEFDKENSEKYNNNADSYTNEIETLKENYAINKGYNIVAMHDSIYYFAESLGLNVVDVVQNDEEDTPAPKRLQEIISNIKNNDVKAIFTEEQYSDRLPNLLSDETEVEVYVFDSITSGDGNPEEYINRMRSNFELIKNIQ